MGTNYFFDLRKNVINIEFEENLIVNRKICVVHEVLGFYDLDDVGYACTLYRVDKYFRLRIFDLDWNEIQYPLGGDSTYAFQSYPLSSPKFVQAFWVKFNEFQMFCEHELWLHKEVNLYDPLSKKFEMFVDKNEEGSIVLFSFSKFIIYYGLNNSCLLLYIYDILKWMNFTLEA